jgi:ComF family protein
MVANEGKSNSNLFTDFVQLFFPRYCLGCEEPMVRGEEVLCSNCLVNLPKMEGWLEESNPVRLKFAGRLPVTYAFAFLKFRKSGLVQHLLHQLKYNHHPEIGVRLGMVYAKELINAGLNPSFDCIIPVPLHSSRKRTRGYNQSHEFARGLATVWGTAVSETISIRKSKTTTQTRKSRWQRWENVQAVFDLAAGVDLTNQHILLVDDVITTGATLEACGSKLIQAGCGKLSIACIAASQ